MAVYKVNSAEQTVSGTTPPSEYWYITLSHVETSQTYGFTPRASVEDSDKNIYVVFSRRDGNGGAVAKINKYGAVQWFYQYKDNQSYYSLTDITMDSAGNLYVTGNTYQSYYNRGHLMKLNNNGGIIFQKHYGDAGSANGGSFQRVVVDSSQNIYIAATIRWNGDPVSKPHFIKYNSDGTKAWDRAFTMDSSGGFECVALDSGGNIYVGGWGFNSGTSNPNGYLVKMDSSGTVLYQTIIDQSGVGNNNQKPTFLQVDSSDNLYAFIEAYETSGTAVLAKYNSAGTLQWQRKFVSPVGSTFSPYGLAINALGQILVGVGQEQYGVGIYAYNSSGTIQWKKRLTFKNGNISSGITNLGVDNFNNLYVMGSTSGVVSSGTEDNFIVKLSADGSGIYSASLLKMEANYAVETLSDAAGSLTHAGGNRSTSSTALTQGNSGVGVTTLNHSVLKAELR